MKLKEALTKKLTGKQLSELKSTYDLIGSIAIMDIPSSLVSSLPSNLTPL